MLSRRLSGCDVKAELIALRKGVHQRSKKQLFAMELIEESGAQSQAEARFTRLPGSIWNLFEIWSLRFGISGLRPANFGFQPVFRL